MDYVHGDIKVFDKNYKLKKIIPIAQAMDASFNLTKKPVYFGTKKKKLNQGEIDAHKDERSST